MKYHFVTVWDNSSIILSFTIIRNISNERFLGRKFTKGKYYLTNDLLIRTIDETKPKIGERVP